MAISIAQPFIHVENSSGLPYVGAKLYVYLVGTTTLAAIYSDAALTIAAANPLTSDAAGNFPRAYIAAGDYKLRAETSAGVLIWQHDNNDTGLSAGSGPLAIARGGTGGITAPQARTNLGAAAQTDLDNLAVTIANLSASLQTIISPPQGRLTPTSLTPVISTSVTAGTAVYYTPYVGNLVPIWDGSKYVQRNFNQLTLTLNANHVANAIYDVFATLSGSTVVIATGPSWNTATAGLGARGAGAGTTQLERVGGIWVNAAEMTARNGATTYSVVVNRATYLGSIHIDGTNGQVSCLLAYGVSRKFGVWNAYNRVPIRLKAGDPAASWAYNVATYRASNNLAVNSLKVFSGLAEDVYHFEFAQAVRLTNATASAAAVQESFIGVGFNSATVISGMEGRIGNSGDVANTLSSGDLSARYIAPPSLGMNEITALEKGNATAGMTTTYQGTEANMLLSAEYMG